MNSDNEMSSDTESLPGLIKPEIISINNLNSVKNEDSSNASSNLLEEATEIYNRNMVISDAKAVEIDDETDIEETDSALIGKNNFDKDSSIFFQPTQVFIEEEGLRVSATPSPVEKEENGPTPEKIFDTFPVDLVIAETSTKQTNKLSRKSFIGKNDRHLENFDHNLNIPESPETNVKNFNKNLQNDEKNIPNDDLMNAETQAYNTEEDLFDDFENEKNKKIIRGDLLETDKQVLDNKEENSDIDMPATLAYCEKIEKRAISDVLTDEYDEQSDSYAPSTLSSDLTFQRMEVVKKLAMQESEEDSELPATLAYFTLDNNKKIKEDKIFSAPKSLLSKDSCNESFISSKEKMEVKLEKPETSKKINTSTDRPSISLQTSDIKVQETNNEVFMKVYSRKGRRSKCHITDSTSVAKDCENSQELSKNNENIPKKYKKSDRKSAVKHGKTSGDFKSSKDLAGQEKREVGEKAKSTTVSQTSKEISGDYTGIIRKRKIVSFVTMSKSGSMSEDSNAEPIEKVKKSSRKKTSHNFSENNESKKDNSEKKKKTSNRKKNIEDSKTNDVCQSEDNPSDVSHVDTVQIEENEKTFTEAMLKNENPKSKSIANNSEEKYFECTIAEKPKRFSSRGKYVKNNSKKEIVSETDQYSNDLEAKELQCISELDSKIADEQKNGTPSKNSKSPFVFQRDGKMDETSLRKNTSKSTNSLKKKQTKSYSKNLDQILLLNQNKTSEQLTSSNINNVMNTILQNEKTNKQNQRRSLRRQSLQSNISDCSSDKQLSKNLVADFNAADNESESSPNSSKYHQKQESTSEVKAKNKKNTETIEKEITNDSVCISSESISRRKTSRKSGAVPFLIEESTVDDQSDREIKKRKKTDGGNKKTPLNKNLVAEVNVAVNESESSPNSSKYHQKQESVSEVKAKNKNNTETILKEATNDSVSIPSEHGSLRKTTRKSGRNSSRNDVAAVPFLIEESTADDQRDREIKKRKKTDGGNKKTPLKNLVADFNAADNEPESSPNSSKYHQKQESTLDVKAKNTNNTKTTEKETTNDNVHVPSDSISQIKTPSRKAGRNFSRNDVAAVPFLTEESTVDDQRDREIKKRKKNDVDNKKTPLKVDKTSVTPLKSVSKEFLASSPGLRQRTNFKVKVMFTGLVDKVLEKIVKDLKGELVDSVLECTHLVTDKVRRTCKFLCIIAQGKPIVTPAWLEKCKESRKFIDWTDYIVKDGISEKQYKFQLTHSIQKASERLLLTNYNIFVTANVKPEPTQMKDIIECAGGKLLAQMPNKKQDNMLIISCDEDRRVCSAALKACIPVVNAEFILTGILRQEISINSYIIFTDDPEKNLTSTKRRTLLSNRGDSKRLCK